MNRLKTAALLNPSARTSENPPLGAANAMIFSNNHTATNAITFGDINSAESQIVRMKKEIRNYEILAELNIKPRTSYLAKLRNPHPELKDS